MAEQEAEVHSEAASSQDAQPDLQLSGFFKLPGEIRNRIYRLVVLQCVPIYPIHWNTRPALMLTCRQLFYEVKGIYYGENTFEFADSALTPRAIDRFSKLSGEGPNPASCPAHIEVFIGSSSSAFSLHMVGPGRTVIEVRNYEPDTSTGGETCRCDILGLVTAYNRYDNLQTILGPKSALLSILKAYLKHHVDLRRRPSREPYQCRTCNGWRRK
jgi:hypothetical protein